jgi:ADP-ribose pyrophosphatase YjhB (NUDIX family)
MLFREEEPGDMPPIKKSRIRPIVIAIVRRGDEILVMHGFDSVKQQRFCRPLGGGIDFGERAVDALRREFLEELGAELHKLRFVAVQENIFELEGAPRHELVFVFEAEFADPRVYDCHEFVIQEATEQLRATWESPRVLQEQGIPLYPDGLMDLLAQS